jgi:hypothetical protein
MDAEGGFPDHNRLIMESSCMGHAEERDHPRANREVQISGTDAAQQLNHEERRKELAGNKKAIHIPADVYKKAGKTDMTEVV